MKASVVPVLILALTAGSVALARPEQAWRDLQREQSGASAQPAPPAHRPSAPAANPGPQHGNAGSGGNWNSNRGNHNGPVVNQPSPPQLARGDSQRNWSQSGGQRDRDYDRNRNGSYWQGHGNSGFNDGRVNQNVWRNYQRHDYDRYRSQYYRFDGRNYYARTRFNLGVYFWPRGYSTRSWYVGDWLPRAYFFDSNYTLYSYWNYNLYDPPVGCNWIRVRDDALLIDNYTGEVLDVVYSVFW